MANPYEVDPALVAQFDANAAGIVAANAISQEMQKAARSDARSEALNMLELAGLPLQEAVDFMDDNAEMINNLLDCGVRAGWKHCTIVNEIAKNDPMTQVNLDAYSKGNEEGYKRGFKDGQVAIS